MERKKEKKGESFLSYKYLEDVAVADVEFEATGKNLEELFVSCAEALENCMADLKSISPKVRKEIKLKNESADLLLYDFLSELIYLKDVEQLLFGKFSVKIKQNKNCELVADVWGEKINSKKHKLEDDVKAVTMHQYKIEKTKSGFKTQILLDI